MRETEEPRLGKPGTTPLPFASDEDRWEAPAAHEEGREVPLMFGSADEPEARRGGIGVWLAAAAALVVGIVVGFGAGYRAAQTTVPVAVSPGDEQPAAGSESPPSRTFSESDVAVPIQIDPEPILSAPPAAADPAAERPPAQTPNATGAPRAVAPREVSPPIPTPRSTPPPPIGPGSLQVVSRPAGARVILDGRLVGTTPLVVPGVAPVEHTVALDLPGFNRWSTTVEVKPGGQLRVAASLEQ